MTPKRPIEPFDPCEEAFMRLAIADNDPGYITRESVCRWMARAFATLDAERAASEQLRAELDPPVCRMQFPDGSVPGNAREAAEGWKEWHDRTIQEMKRLRESNKELVAACKVFTAAVAGLAKEAPNRPDDPVRAIIWHMLNDAKAMAEAALTKHEGRDGEPS